MYRASDTTLVLQRALIFLALSAAILVFLFPFFWMLSTSLKTLREASVMPPNWLPAAPQFENYAIAFARAPLFRYGLNSLIISLAVICLVVSLAMMAGYALVFLKFRGKEFVFLALLAPQMVAGVVLLLPLFAVLSQLNMLNKLHALIIPYTVLFSPFAVMLVRRYTASLPRELVEAARVDGATEIWIMTRIVFPLVKPALATVALFCFIWSWNEFLFAMVYLQRPDLRTISVGLAFLQAVPDFPREMNIIMAAAAAVTIPVLVVFSFMQRQFIEGMTLGAVK